MPVIEAGRVQPGAKVGGPWAIANGLKWLSPQIDASLQRVRSQIDQQQDADDDDLDVEAILAELKLVLGALQLADCRGGLLLAEELCAAVQVVKSGSLSEPAAALAAVSGASLQLSDYLDLLSKGVADRAAILQPAISELRLACGKPVVAEADLFTRQMQGWAPALPAPSAQARVATAQVVAANLLPQFQALLLQWLKGADLVAVQSRLRKAGDYLRANAEHPEVVLLWSAFAATMDSLLAAPGVAALELKRWVGRMGHQIKVLAEQGEAAAATEAGNSAWQLLARAAPLGHAGERWDELRKHLPLDETLPVEPALSEARRQLRGPNSNLLATVVTEVRADLTLVKDSLDLALRSGGLLQDAQASLAERLMRVASTMVLLGLPQLEQVLRAQADKLKALGSSRAEDRERWMEVATALLRVEHSLAGALSSALPHTGEEGEGGAQGSSAPHQHEMQDSVAALLREMLVDIAKLKSGLDAYLKGGLLRNPNEPVQWLAEIASGLNMLKLDEAAMQAASLRDWLDKATVNELRSDPVAAVRFAEAVAVLEIYLESLRDALPQPERVLVRLGSVVQVLTEQSAAPAVPVVQASTSGRDADQLAALSESLMALDALQAVSQTRSDQAQTELTPSSSQPAAETEQAEETVGEQQATATEDFLPQVQVPTVELGTEAVVQALGITASPSPIPPAAAGDDDPEIRAIFIEEAQDVLGVLQQQLPAFRHDPTGDALGEIRRSFHTLKGSGRMVGASEIGEFGWAVEHLLNRCIDGALPLTPAVVQLVETAIEQLPALLMEFQAGRTGSEEDAVHHTISHAHFLASGRAPEMVESEVLEVFRADALDRLSDIGRWLGDEQEKGIDIDALRALHTLKGSAAVVNAEALSRLAGAIERVLKHLLSVDAALPPEVRAVLVEALPVMHHWVAQAGGQEPADGADWLARVDALKPFLPPPGETQNSARREVLVNQAFDRLQQLEQCLGMWTAVPGDASLATAMANAADALHTAAQECTSLGRGAEAMAERLRQDDVLSTRPDPQFFMGMANALEHFYQFLDAYREGGVRDSGRELAALLRQIPLRSPSADLGEEAAPEPAPSPGAVEPVELTWPPVPEAPVLLADLPSELIESEPAEPASLTIPTEASAEDGLEPLELQAIPYDIPVPPEVVDSELATVFVEEAREIMAVLKVEVPLWQPPAVVSANLLRALHTLTGSARMAGYPSLGDLAHGFERRLIALEPGASRSSVIHAELQSVLPVFEQAIDTYEQMVPHHDEPESESPAEIHSDPAPTPEVDAAAMAMVGQPPSSPAGVAWPGLPSAHSDAAAWSEAFIGTATGEESVDVGLLSDGIDDDLPGDRQQSVTLSAEPTVQSLPNMADDLNTVPETSALGEPILREKVSTEPIEALLLGQANEAIDPELANIFIAEASEMLETIDGALSEWRRDAGDTAAIGELQRALHTLKGGARMTGIPQMGDVSHAMESRVAEILDRGTAPVAADHAALKGDLELLERQHDALMRGHYAMTLHGAEPAREVFTTAADEGGVDYEMARPKAAPPRSSEPAPEGWEPGLFWRPEQDVASATRRELARVPVDALDAMLNEAGEISIYRSRLEQQNAALLAQLAELRQTVVRLREQLRLLDAETDAQIAARGLTAQGAVETDRYAQDFDPLEMDRYSRMQELSRALSESVGDLNSLHLTMDQGINDTQALLLQQGRINTSVQQGLMSTLMVPFSRQVGRLQRVVRQVAQEEGKFVDVRFEGGESELDRNVLERMTASLEHLLRNAVVHGLEDQQSRTAMGKPAMGTVTVSLKREGTQLVMDVADDGRGLNFKAIRTKAIERGLLPADAVLGDDEVARFIFEPGFSTAETLTQTAGRGVGMDVVASEVKQLGGSLELHSEANKGTRFSIRLPMSLSLSQALMVQVQDETYALPLVAIEGIGRVPMADAARAASGGEAEFSYGGHRYQVRYLSELIDQPITLLEDARTVPAVLLRLGEGVAGGERRAALIVDQLLGNREVVSKGVGSQLSSISGISGATILPTGAVVLILDPAALVIDRARRRLIAEAAASRSALEQQNTQSGRLIMVVDDSVTMRRVAERLLQRNGYRVVTAKDGLDAISLLQTETPAAILLDIEMPRADGFEVAGFVRGNERISQTPIIMITSRSGDKHRTRAASLGVDRYLIKPYQEDHLLHELRALLQTREAKSA